MTLRSLRCFSILGGVLVAVLLVSSAPTGARDLSEPPLAATQDSTPLGAIASTRRVNAPYFDGKVIFSECAVFWFGRLTLSENSVDVRVGYNDDHLRIHVAAFDRRVWYDRSPSPEDLIDWDSVSLYLNTNDDVYRFDSQTVWWEERDHYQAAYRLDGSDWMAYAAPFTTTSDWRGNQPNDDENDRGWWTSYYIPFDSLGLDSTPVQGTVWGMALALHDRDDRAGTPIPDQVWPETMALGQGATWGQLAFGMPTYSPQPAIPGGAVTIRHGLEGASVVDADVGGSSVCGRPAAPDYFSTWGELNYAGKEFLNIQNQFDVADWPCFSRVYVTFPLDAVPAEKVIISATLTLHLWGSAGEGWDPGPQPSFIQVLTVGEDWDEDTITWNNAPLAETNIGGTWVQPVEERVEGSGIRNEWDVSGAAAEVYAKGEPFRLALYEADFDYHSGKYFHSSDVGEWNAEGRPTLSITWGRAVPELNKVAVPTSGDEGTPIAYTLNFLGTGETLTLTDTLPAGMAAPGDFELEGTTVTPAYDSNERRLMWTDALSVGQQAAICYTATLTTSERRAVANTAELSQVGSDTSTAAAIIIANPHKAYLPLILREN